MRKSVLGQLFNGEIYPAEQSKPKDERYEEAVQGRSENKEKLYEINVRPEGGSDTTWIIGWGDFANDNFGGVSIQLIFINPYVSTSFIDFEWTVEILKDSTSVCSVSGIKGLLVRTTLDIYRRQGRL